MRIPTAAGLLVVIVSAAANAQVPTPGFGVGVSLDMTPTSGFSLTVGGGLSFEARMGNIHFPIGISPSFRLEPMLGYARESQEGSIGTQTSSEAVSALRLGVGFLYLMPQRGGSFQMYAGPRAGIWRLRAKLTSEVPGFPTYTQTFHQDNKFVAGVFGGEYFVAAMFSIGGEVQLSYTDYGEIDVDVDPSPGPVPDTDNDGSKVETAGLIVLRWFP